MADRAAVDPLHPAYPARPGEGPLFGAGSAFTPPAIRQRVLARVATRAEAALRAIEARALESGWENPPLESALAALPGEAREKLLLSADFRRWTTRVLRATHPGAPPDAALPVLVQSAWNLILVPWLAAPAAAQAAAPRSLWLMVYGDGTVPLPGSGLTLTETGGGRRVRLTLANQTLRFAAENGAPLAEVARPALLAAAAGDAAARLPGPWRIAPRIDGGRIELTGADAAARVAELESAMATLAQAWPEGAELVRGLARRIELAVDPELRSKTVSELPGLVILGGWAAGPRAVAELLVHEAAHLLVYEVARLDTLLPAPEAMRRSPFSRAPARPAFMLLHGIVSFLAQAVTSARWPGAFAASTGDDPVNLGAELERLLAGAKELTAHLAEHGAPAPHPFIAALDAELALFRQWHARAGRA